MTKMRRRLAKKIVDHPQRYSIGRQFKALNRLGWKDFRIEDFRFAVSVQSVLMKVPTMQFKGGVRENLGNGWERITVGDWKR